MINFFISDDKGLGKYNLLPKDSFSKYYINKMKRARKHSILIESG